jgi:hypothetical protein
MSYLFAKCGASENRLEPSKWMEGWPEQAYRGEKVPLSFSHFNHGPCKFLGVEIDGKWSIPDAIEKAGIKA